MAPAGYRALLIGNSTFPEDPNNLQDLKGPINDIARLHYALTDATTGLFATDDVRLLPERSVMQILKALEEFFRDSTRAERLLLYYSGHGLLTLKGELLLAARDTRTDSLLATTVGATAINRMIDESAALTTIIVLDCCHSGAFRSGELPKSLEGSGRYVLSSTRSGELANDADENTRTSRFTGYLIEGLVSGAPDDDADGFVDLDDLYSYVHRKLTETTSGTTKQIPHRKFDGNGDVQVARRQADRPDSGPVKPVLGTPRPDEPVTKGLRLPGPPRLEVSDELLEVRDIAAHEELPFEWVAVLNQGGGALDWYAVADADWLTVTSAGDYVRIGLHPRPGTNRGSVLVQDRGPGGSKVIRVRAYMREPPPPAPPPAWWRAHLAQLAAGVVALLIAALVVAFVIGRDETTSADVVVDGARFWTDTGLDVAVGDRVEVQADGTVFHNEAESVGPEGEPVADLINPVQDAPHGALIGRVGGAGDPFFVGGTATMTVEDDGRLYLGINDPGVNNNSGAFTAAVTVTPAGTG
jgi:hypothetical protein